MAWIFFAVASLPLRAQSSAIPLSELLSKASEISTLPFTEKGTFTSQSVLVAGQSSPSFRNSGSNYYSVAYKLTTSRTENVSIKFELSSDAYLYVYQKNADNSYELVNSDDDRAGNSNSLLELSLKPGEYYFVGTSYQPNTLGNYTMSVDHIKLTTLNELLDKAPAIATLPFTESGGFTVQSDLVPGQTNPSFKNTGSTYYAVSKKVTIDTPKAITATFSFDSNATLYLYKKNANNSYTVVAQNGNSRSCKLNLKLTTGEYYLVGTTENPKAQGAYTFEVTNSTSLDLDQLLLRASNIEALPASTSGEFTLQSTSTFGQQTPNFGEIGGSYYAIAKKLILDTPKAISATFTFAISPAIYLYKKNTDNSYTLIEKKYNWNGNSTKIDRQLAAGEYYIVGTSNNENATGTYSLEITNSSTITLNQLLNEADPIGSMPFSISGEFLAQAKSVFGQSNPIFGDDSKASYAIARKLTLSESKYLAIKFKKGYYSNLYVYRRNTDNKYELYKQTYSSDNPTIEQIFAPGDYYIVGYSSEVATNETYSFVVEQSTITTLKEFLKGATEIDPLNFTQSGEFNDRSARVIGQNNPGFGFSDEVHYAVAYKINLSTTKNLAFKYEHSQKEGRFYIYKKDGNNYSDVMGYSFEPDPSFDIKLNAGEYYLVGSTRIPQTKGSYSFKVNESTAISLNDLLEKATVIDALPYANSGEFNNQSTAVLAQSQPPFGYNIRSHYATAYKLTIETSQNIAVTYSKLNSSKANIYLYQRNSNKGYVLVSKKKANSNGNTGFDITLTPGEYYFVGSSENYREVGAFTFNVSRSTAISLNELLTNAPDLGVIPSSKEGEFTSQSNFVLGQTEPMFGEQSCGYYAVAYKIATDTPKKLRATFSQATNSRIYLYKKNADNSFSLVTNNSKNGVSPLDILLQAGDYYIVGTTSTPRTTGTYSLTADASTSITLSELISGATEIKTLPFNTSGEFTNQSTPVLSQTLPEFGEYGNSYYAVAHKVIVSTPQSVEISFTSRRASTIFLYKKGASGKCQLEAKYRRGSTTSLEMQLSAGEYYIVGSAYEPRETGEYALEVKKSPALTLNDFLNAAPSIEKLPFSRKGEFTEESPLILGQNVPAFMEAGGAYFAVAHKLTIAKKQIVSFTRSSNSEFFIYKKNGENNFSLINKNLWDADKMLMPGEYYLLQCSHFPRMTGSYELTAKEANLELYVNGTNIITAPNNTVACGSGSATYNASNSTLTLNNAEITATTPNQPKAGIVAKYGEVKIMLEGNNSIHPAPTEESLSAGISTNLANITIDGNGSVSIIGGDVSYKQGISSGIYATQSSITIAGGNVNITGGAISNEAHSWGVFCNQSTFNISGGSGSAKANTQTTTDIAFNSLPFFKNGVGITSGSWNGTECQWNKGGATPYGVYANGQEFTANQLSIACGKGMATYDPNSFTLKLKNADITNTYKLNNIEFGIVSFDATNTINIAFEGSNSITSPSNINSNVALQSYSSLNIAGKGTLTITAPGKVSNTQGIVANDSITIQSGNIQITGGQNCNSTSSIAANTITIRGGNIIATTFPCSYTSTALLNWYNDVTITGGMGTLKGGDRASNAIPKFGPQSFITEGAWNQKICSWSSIFTLTFDAIGGETTTTSKNLSYGDTFGDLPTPTKKGHTFAGWKIGDSSIDASKVWNYSSNQTAQAQWTVNSYTIAATTSIDAAGNISGAGSYPYNASCTLTATAKRGYAFTGWKENLVDVASNSAYTFNVDASDRTLVASFEPIDFTVTQPTDKKLAGAITVTPAAGFEYSINGTTYQSSNVFSDIPVGTYTITLKKVSDGTIYEASKLAVVGISELVATTNYQLKATNCSCRGTNDGILKLNMSKAFDYEISIKGEKTGSKTPYLTSGTELTVTNLVPDNYTVTFRIAALSGYEQNFDVTIAEPEALNVQKVDNAKNMASYHLKGGEQYYVTLNGNTTQTYDSDLQLSLKLGENRIRIATEKLCQGVFEEVVHNDGSTNFIMYPNPATDKVTVRIPETEEKDIFLQIVSLPSGSICFSQKYAIYSGSTIELNVSNLPSGTYGVIIKGTKLSYNQKLIKM
ncbi:InlB B-repeat-containing protein [Alistipes sp. ZOR0009]|uniref:InlB B-repeat-containing protein n=1 Tax=Alistipes sp. ZOR0009 TaxID=1339253 RepID=UPI0006492220|nr:T9SS type A sorting domain-containing protein [Alistipes sp. ZOR0009]